MFSIRKLICDICADSDSDHPINRINELLPMERRYACRSVGMIGWRRKGTFDRNAICDRLGADLSPGPSATAYIAQRRWLYLRFHSGEIYRTSTSRLINCKTFSMPILWELPVCPSGDTPDGRAPPRRKHAARQQNALSDRCCRLPPKEGLTALFTVTSTSKPVSVAGGDRFSSDPIQGLLPSNSSHETLECQFTNVPLGFGFHAHTCSV